MIHRDNINKSNINKSNKDSSMKKFLGAEGEKFAQKTVQEKGLKIIKRNYRCPKGEMDIIARDNNQLIFIEVRTKTSGIRGWGEESITRVKKERLKAIAAYYILKEGYKEWPSVRFDLIALKWKDEKFELNWIESIL